MEAALRDGVLVRPARCEKCRKKPKILRNGKTAIQAHHDDYNKPLEVRWLCKGCHFKWHQTHTAIPLVEGTQHARRERRARVNDDHPNDLAARLWSADDAFAAMLVRAGIPLPGAVRFT